MRAPSTALTLAGLALALAACTPGLPAPRADAFVLPAVRLVEPALERSGPVDLVVSGGRIRSPAAAGQVPVTLDEYAGMTVLPGLVDMHTHLPPDTALDLTAYFGLLYLAHGVTAVREAGDLDGSGVAAAERAAEAGRPMPRILSCGPFVGGAEPRWENWLHLERPDQAEAVATRLRREGRVCIKVYDGLDEARVHALVAAAQAAGLAPMGHVPFGLTLEQARIPDTQHLMGVALPQQIAAGDHVVHRIMDWRGVDAARIDQAVVASVELGLAHTPTLGLTHQLLHYEDYEASLRDPSLAWMPGLYRQVVWSPEEGLALYRGLGPDDFAMLRDAWPKKLALVRGLHEAGVTLRLGTDTQQPFVVPGLSIWNELRHFVEAGVPAEEAWAHGSWRSADGLGGGAPGRLTPGAPADLLVFRQDPTRDLAALESLEAVVAGGRLYRRADLLEALEAWRAFYDGPVVGWVARFVARRRLEESVRSDR